MVWVGGRSPACLSFREINKAQQLLALLGEPAHLAFCLDECCTTVASFLKLKGARVLIELAAKLQPLKAATYLRGLQLMSTWDAVADPFEFRCRVYVESPGVIVSSVRLEKMDRTTAQKSRAWRCTANNGSSSTERRGLHCPIGSSLHE
jgi:hypothetical protein